MRVRGDGRQRESREFEISGVRRKEKAKEFRQEKLQDGLTCT